jgi:dnd system-associated protein 4
VDLANRLWRAPDKEPIYQELVDSDDAPFVKLKDAFLMAACIGSLQKESEGLKGRGKEFLLSVFSDDADKAIMDALAFAKTDDLTILLNTEEKTNKKYKIVEEYANAGIVTLKKRLLDAPGKPLDNLVDYILEYDQVDSTGDGGSIGGLADDLGL